MSYLRMVGAARFELATPCAQGRCATRLRYAPTGSDPSIIPSPALPSARDSDNVPSTGSHMHESDQCPVCLERMCFEERDADAWLVCPNGCPTEVQVPSRKPAASASDLNNEESWVLRANA